MKRQGEAGDLSDQEVRRCPATVIRDFAVSQVDPLSQFARSSKKGRRTQSQRCSETPRIHWQGVFCFTSQERFFETRRKPA